MRLTEAIRSALSAIGANALRSLLDHARHRHRRRGGDRHGGDRLGRAQPRRPADPLARREPRHRHARQRHAGRGAARRRRLLDPDRRGRRGDQARDRGRRRGGALRARRRPGVYGGTNWGTAVYAVDLDYFAAREWDVETGRGFDPEEIRRGEIVALLGKTVAKNLFGEADPLDEVVRVRNVPFKVIGVMASKGQSRLRPGPGRRDLRAARRRAPPRDRTQLRQGRARSARSSSSSRPKSDIAARHRPHRRRCCASATACPATRRTISRSAT